MNSMSRSSGRSLTTALVLMVAAALVGCGAPGQGSESVTEVRVDKSFWHNGFRVTLGTAKIVEQADTASASPPQQRVVTIDVTLANLGTRLWSFRACGPTNLRSECGWSALVLSSGGRHYTEPAPQQDLPKIPGKASQSGMIAFVVDESFRLDDAVLTVGTPDVRQAVVPLTGDQGLVSLEPRSLDITGEVAVFDHVFTVDGGELRADSPQGYFEATAGHEYLRLHYAVTNTGPSVTGGTLKLDTYHYLMTPNDDTLSPAGSCGGSIEYPQPGVTVPDLMICFEVPVPAAGEYLFFVKDGQADGISFTIT